MVQLLSYAHVAIGGSRNLQAYSRMGSSVRKLFTGLANSKGASMKFVATVQQRLPRSYAQASRSFEKSVEMKKGDWICGRCSFMNFAKNSQCRQCDEHRPKKVLTGGEWECPECNFCNFGRNVVCLRCDCKRPGDNRFLSPTSAVGLSAATSSVKGDTKKIKDGIEEQPWFTKIVELEKSSDMSNAVAYGELPKTMSAGDNKFDASTRNSGIKPDQIDRRTNNDENRINLNFSQSSPGIFSSISQLEQHNEPNARLNTDAPVQQLMTREQPSSQLTDIDYAREQAEKSERLFKKVAELGEVSPDTISKDNFSETMPMRRGENQFVVGKTKDRSLTSPTYKRRVAMEQTGKNNYVPFVPFPPGYFAKEKTQEGSESTHSNVASNDVSRNLKTSDSQYSPADDSSKSQDSSKNASIRASWGEKSLEGSAVKEPDPLDMSEEAKAERWFRRVAQIKDISELSQIPDEDFPSIMPMRKGVNRFVVSKRKTPLERRLTSPQYRRNLPAVGPDPMKKETDSNQES